MRGTSIAVVLVCAGVIAAQSPDSRQEVHGYLGRQSFDSAEIARIELAPVVSLVHGVIYSPRSRPDRTLVVQKQLYASHYYDGSLAIATLLDTQDAGQPATHLVYANRSRGDLLKGGFGGLKRNVARSQARKAAGETLGNIKRMLESARQ